MDTAAGCCSNAGSDDDDGYCTPAARAPMRRQALMVDGSPSCSGAAVAKGVVKAAELGGCMVVGLGSLVGEGESCGLRCSSRLQPC